jgi:uncharacterized protein YcbK (DUF882 family)
MQGTDQSDPTLRGLSRLKFCKSSLLAVAGIALPTQLLAKGIELFLPERRLSFYNTHTGESLKNVTFWSNGTYQPDALTQIHQVLRDHRSGQVAEIDLKLLDQLCLLNQSLKNSEPLHIISGYRSPRTNNQLRNTGGGGVAKHSLHMDGRAIDIRLPGCSVSNLHKAALALKEGGVGYYPNSQFVHLDTGRVRYWSGA